MPHSTAAGPVSVLGDMGGRVMPERPSPLVQVVERDSSAVEGYHAGGKARRDVEAVLRSLGAREAFLDFDGSARVSRSAVGKALGHVSIAARWKRLLGSVDAVVLFVQLPLEAHSVFAADAFRSLGGGAKLVALVHDLDSLRGDGVDADAPRPRRVRIRREEIDVLRECDAVVVHNETMRDMVSRAVGIGPERVVPLGLFDYLSGGRGSRGPRRSGQVAIAGNLEARKAGYVRLLPGDVPYALYGLGTEGERLPANVSCKGTFDPDSGPSAIEGSFGLVWDGGSIETCSGVYGEYLRVNNPHKTSLYLAAGLPVIIWDQAALAPFVREHGCGICVPSLVNLREVLDSVSDAEYEAMCASAAALSEKVRSGWFTSRAVGAALEALGIGDCG